MTLFLTKVWGWDVPVGPLQFSTNGWRQNALDQLKSGDRVVLVGTMGDQTPENMKGRLLGVMEPSSEPVMSLDFPVRQRDSDFVDGNYKWPVGLMNLRAWSLPQRPELSQISKRRFSMDSAQGIVPLTDEETAAVEALDWREEELLQPTMQAHERLARKHGYTGRKGPPPATTKRTGIMHMRRAPAYTYAMKVVGAQPEAFKIGWAFDYKQRARQFNQASMPSLGGLEYRPFRYQLRDTARMAYAMEQALLAHFADHITTENNEIVSGVTERQIDAAFIAAVSGKL